MIQQSCKTSIHKQTQNASKQISNLDSAEKNAIFISSLLGKLYTSFLEKKLLKFGSLTNMTHANELEMRLIRIRYVFNPSADNSA